MRDDNLFKAASGLHGGIGWMRDTCGALLGASLILGLKYGRGQEEIDNPQNREDPAVAVGKLYKWFDKEFGSATCREIRARFAGKETREFEKCDELTGKVATRTVEMLWDAIEAEKKK